MRMKISVYTLTPSYAYFTSLSSASLPSPSPSSFQEQTHSVELQGQLHSNTVLNRAVVELQEMVDDLRAEKDILKKANDKLMKRCVPYIFFALPASVHVLHTCIYMYLNDLGLTVTYM